MNDNGKTIAIVSYITLIGWIVAIILHSQEQNKSHFAAFHLRQSLGLICTGFALSIVSVPMMIIPLINFLWMLLAPLIGLALLALLIVGVINAANGESKPLPVVGPIYARLFSSLG